MAVVEPLSRPDDTSSVALGTGQAVVRTALLNRLCGAPEGAISDAEFEDLKARTLAAS